MYSAKCYLKSKGPISFGRPFSEPELEGEDKGQFEKRTWREKVHTNGDGRIIIPGIMFKKSLDTLAGLLAEKVSGRGNNQYKSRFQAGVIVENDITLDIKKEDLESEEYYVPSDGKPGGGTRVMKTFPLVREWEGCLEVTVVPDDIITKKVFERYLSLAGVMSGIGRFRPAKGGNKGKWTVEKIEYRDTEVGVGS